MTYFASGATMTSFFGISVMSTSVVSTRAAMDAAFSMALMVTLKRNGLVGEGEMLRFNPNIHTSDMIWIYLCGVKDTRGEQVLVDVSGGVVAESEWLVSALFSNYLTLKTGILCNLLDWSGE